MGAKEGGVAHYSVRTCFRRALNCNTLGTDTFLLHIAQAYYIGIILLSRIAIELNLYIGSTHVLDVRAMVRWALSVRMPVVSRLHESIPLRGRVRIGFKPSHWIVFVIATDDANESLER